MCFLIYWLAIIFTSFSGTLENLLKCVDQVEGESIRKVEIFNMNQVLAKIMSFSFPFKSLSFFVGCSLVWHLQWDEISSVNFYQISCAISSHFIRIHLCVFVLGVAVESDSGFLFSNYWGWACNGFLFFHVLGDVACIIDNDVQLSFMVRKEDVEVCHQGYCTSRKYKLIYHVMILCSWNLR